MADDNLKLLIRKRGAIKAKLTIFVNYLNELTSNDSSLLKNELEMRNIRFQNLLTEFDTVQDEIEIIASDEVFDQQLQERASFERDFFQASNRVSEILQQNIAGATLPNAVGSTRTEPSVHGVTNQAQNASVNSHAGSSGGSILNCIPPTASHPLADTQLPNVKLPVLQLEKFDGKTEHFPAFYDAFRSLVHNNNKLDDISRFLYLRSCLSEDALKVIKSLEVTSINYQVAWDLLKRRYLNTNLMVHNHIKGICEFPKIQKDSASNLLQLLDNTQNHVRALIALGEPVQSWNSILIYLVSDKFPYQTKKEWEIKIENIDTDQPTYDIFINFLEKRCKLLQKIEIQAKNDSNPHQFKKVVKNDPKSYSRTFSHVATKGFHCKFCKSNDHFIPSCRGFLNLSIQERKSQISRLGLCDNCLREHKKNDCKSGHCKKCPEFHSTLLHSDSNTFSTTRPDSTSASTTLNNHSLNVNCEQILATARLLIFSKDSMPFECTALLDCGSMRSYITSSLCKKLNLDLVSTDISVVGINQTKTKIACYANARFKSLHNDFSEELPFLVLPKITETFPMAKISLESLSVPSNIPLANVNFARQNKIDVLLGVDIFWRLISVDQPYIAKYPYLINSVLGYIISGNISLNSSMKPKITTCNLTLSSISKQISRFWEQENCETNESILSVEENQCEVNFSKTTTRNKDGNFVVSIPLAHSPKLLGDSKTRAVKQFLSLERRLNSNPLLKSMYTEFMLEYEQLGHMVKVNEDNDNVLHNTYYMPHHCVIRDQSLTTKLRVVFNSSSPSSSGLSLNDIQMNGPTLQNDLFSIILRFRRFKFILSADCSKMFRCVFVTPEQRSLQRIIWRTDPCQPLETYELCTVTYGQKASSYLAIRCLFELANLHSKESPEISNIIKKDMYCDDLLTSVDSLEATQQICANISKILKSGGFVLRKWTSNDTKTLDLINKDDISNKILEIGPDESTKTLGLSYNPSLDYLVFNIREFNSSELNPSKRQVLSIISQIFDPLGLLGPCIVTTKIFMQELWLTDLKWDDPLPEDLALKWKLFLNELPLLNNLRIPRHAMLHQPKEIQIHSFADASLKAYGACVYLKSVDESNNVSVCLLCAKTRVAPLKTITIPKLELSAALLSVKLTAKVENALELPVNSKTYWSDSQIVLAWINTEPYRLKMYVANRVCQIQTLSSPTNWRYVPTSLNPADLLTRGVSCRLLLDQSLWWHGPDFLANDISSWPHNDTSSPNLVIPELKVSHQLCISQKEPWSFPFHKFSDFQKLQRICAYCLRFIQNTRKGKQHRLTGVLTQEEISEATLNLVRLSQAESFPEEIADLSRARPISKKSKLSCLNPFFDEQHNIIRVGGRLHHSDFAYEKKHPIVISSKHHLASLIFRHEHRRLLHAGPQLLLSAIREKYWIIGGRSLAKYIVKGCILCVKAKPKLYQHIMGNLPPDRVKQNYPFNICGTDFAGPFLLKDKTGRGAKTTKCYFVIFVCFVTKAVHLELVSSLTTDAFILALRRFASRRGMPSKILSDNGKTYVAANSQLKELGNFLLNNKGDLERSFLKDNFNWSFIPPYSPHMGGIWESGVKSTKYHLKRVIGETALSFENLYSLLVQVEGILNSRPLLPLSSDPSDLTPLTPSHFLVGRPITSVPDPSLDHIPANKLSMYQHLQFMSQQFWKRWALEYVSELQQRYKWKEQSANLKEGTLVLIKNNNLPPAKWQLGRVTAIHPGSDNVTRVVSIRTATGTIQRAASRICPLLLENETVSGCLSSGPVSLNLCVCVKCRDELTKLLEYKSKTT